LRNPKGTVTDIEEQVVSSGGKLVVKPINKKPTADQLTAGQWIAANAIILSRLFSRFSTQQLCDYLDYERKIGGLMQLFTHSSVFILDNEHRIDVHKYGGKWNKINPIMVASILKKKDESSLPAGMSTGGYRGVSSATSVQLPRRSSGAIGPGRMGGGGICWAYNSAEGCTYGTTCRYRHVESSRNRPVGPAERSPHFQNAIQGPPSNG
jgi:hypothetical protein